MADVAGRFDLIIDIAPYVHALNPYLSTSAKIANEFCIRRREPVSID
jgi:hypothetical protein